MFFSFFSPTSLYQTGCCQSIYCEYTQRHFNGGEKSITAELYLYIFEICMHISLKYIYMYMNESLGRGKNILAADPPNPVSLRIKTAQLGRAWMLQQHLEVSVLTSQSPSTNFSANHLPPVFQPIIFHQFFSVLSSVQNYSIQWMAHLPNASILSMHPLTTSVVVRLPATHSFFSACFWERKQDSIVIEALGLIGEAKGTTDLCSNLSGI